MFVLQCSVAFFYVFLLIESVSFLQILKVFMGLSLHALLLAFCLFIYYMGRQLYNEESNCHGSKYALHESMPDYTD